MEDDAAMVPQVVVRNTFLDFTRPIEPCRTKTEPPSASPPMHEDDPPGPADEQLHEDDPPGPADEPLAMHEDDPPGLADEQLPDTPALTLDSCESSRYWESRLWDEQKDGSPMAVPSVVHGSDGVYLAQGFGTAPITICPGVVMVPIIPMHVIPPDVQLGMQPPPPHASPPQRLPLEKSASVNSRVHRIHWTVNADRLDSKDTHAASPKFDLSFSEESQHIDFQIIIKAKEVTQAKGGKSFKKARGRGNVQLKCHSLLPHGFALPVTFRIAIGSGDTRKPLRGPVTHDFSQNAVAGLPEGSEEWDFREVVDQESKTFVVCLEVIPAA